MGVDDNPKNTPVKQKQKIHSTKTKTQEVEKSSLSAGASSEHIGGRSLRLRQRTTPGNTSGSGIAEATHSE